MHAENNFPKLGPIIIGTSSIEKAKQFYSSVFGIRIEHEEAHYLSARGVDGTHIELEEDSESRFPHWAEHNVGTYKNSEFLVPDIHYFVETVVQHGGKVISKPIARPWGGFAAEVADLDGNIFLISQR